MAADEEDLANEVPEPRTKTLPLAKTELEYPDKTEPLQSSDANGSTTALSDATTRRVDRSALQEKEDDVGPTRHVSSLKPKEEKTEPLPNIPMKLSEKALIKLRGLRRKGLDAAVEPFGKYALLGTIGRGGMAEINLAAEIQKDGGVRLCVVKRIIRSKHNSKVLRQLFEEESRVCSFLQHPHIVELFDSGEIDDTPYLVFELIDGVNLRELQQLVAPSLLPLRPILEIGIQAAGALAYAHAARTPDNTPLNLVHRDVTPQNVLLSRDGVTKLVDFGIARFEGREHETRRGHVKGKFGYMAPEQCRIGPIDHRIDIFALGLIITELLSGRRVLPPTVLAIAETESLIRDHCASVDYEVPNALVNLLIKMTAVEAKDRLSDAAEAVAHLQAVHRNVSGPALVEYVESQVFSRLLPLDLNNVVEPPTNLYQVEDEDEDEDEDAEAVRYSSTVQRLRPLKMGEAPNLDADTTPPPAPEDIARTRKVASYHGTDEEEKPSESIVVSHRGPSKTLLVALLLFVVAAVLFFLDPWAS